MDLASRQKAEDLLHKVVKVTQGFKDESIRHSQEIIKLDVCLANIRIKLLEVISRNGTEGG